MATSNIGQTHVQARFISRDELLRLQQRDMPPATVRPPEQFYAAALQQIYSQGGFAGLNIVIENEAPQNA